MLAFEDAERLVADDRSETHLDLVDLIDCVGDLLQSDRLDA